jgi:hypothetical protein
VPSSINVCINLYFKLNLSRVPLFRLSWVLLL